MKKTIAMIISAAALICAGCTSTSYTDSTGAKFARVSLFTNQNIGTVQLKAGEKTLAIENYTTQAETAAAIAAAVAKVYAPTK